MGLRAPRSSRDILIRACSSSACSFVGFTSLKPIFLVTLTVKGKIDFFNAFNIVLLLVLRRWDNQPRKHRVSPPPK